MTSARIMLHNTSTDPTDRSMPPVMITMVMPSATTATKVKLRVTLNRLFEVANELVANDRNTQATQTATNTQNACRDVSHDRKGNLLLRTLSASSMSIKRSFTRRRRDRLVRSFPRKRESRARTETLIVRQK